MTDIKGMVHPDYHKEARYWIKYRLAYAGGGEFIDKFLFRFSKREDYYEWKNRKKITYVPAYAKAAVIDVKNSIHQRLVDVSRKGGPVSYQEAVTGVNGGVDLTGNSMNSFMGNVVLDELLPMRKVGIFVDKPAIPESATRNQVQGVRPYLYTYAIEDIRSWAYDTEFNLVALLLRNHTEDLNDWGLPTKTKVTFSLYRLIDGRVEQTNFNSDGKQLSTPTQTSLTMIPFIMPTISKSLMSDIADYQIAAMNLASADMNYAQKANFPFYTEEYDPATDIWLRQALDSGTSLIEGTNDTYGASTEGTATKAAISDAHEVEVGSLQGRRYAKGLKQPGFINPSPEPLRVSMEKQKILKEEVRELINLNLASLQSRRASAESKKEDSVGKEEGLSNIGLELEHAERKIAEIWAMYENEEAAEVKYPNTYSLRSDQERRDEADDLIESSDNINSPTLRKVAGKYAAQLIMGHKIPREIMTQIEKEIDEATTVFTNPKNLREDLEAGLVDPETASKARGYPEGTITKAQDAHAKRLAMIAESQGGQQDPARGGEGLGADGTVEKLDKPKRGDGNES